MILPPDQLVRSHKLVSLKYIVSYQLCPLNLIIIRGPMKLLLISVLLQQRLVALVIGPYTKAASAAVSVYAFPWMGLKSTTSFIHIVRSFTCRPNHDMGPIFCLRTDARPTRTRNPSVSNLRP